MFAVLKPQSLTNRFRVPLNFNSRLSIGYDDNYLKLSESEIYKGDLKQIADAQGISSSIIKPSLKIIYSPILIDGYITRLTSSLSYSYFMKSKKKSYLVSNFAIEIKLGSYSWLKMGTRNIPKYYLRNYYDRDLSTIEYYECSFSSAGYFSSYSFPLKSSKRLWAKLYTSFTQEYYNPNFTEFDLNKWMLQIELNKRWKNKNQFKVAFGHGIAKNLSYGSLFSTSFLDRSYIFDKLRADINLHFRKNKVIRQAILTAQFDQRYYELESQKYSFDNWKYYLDGKVKFKIDWKFGDSFDVSSWYQYRFRNADAKTYGDFEWIEGAKSYSKHEVWLELSYKFITDVLY